MYTVVFAVHSQKWTQLQANAWRPVPKNGLALYLSLLCDKCLGLERQETSRRQMTGQSEARTDWKALHWYSNTTGRQVQKADEKSAENERESGAHSCTLFARAKLISLFLMPLSADSIKKYTVMMICVLRQRERIPLIPHECYNWHLIALG